MALKIVDYGSPEYQQMLKLRYEVLRKPLGLSFSQTELEKEKDNLFIGAFEEEQLLGCCMIVKEDAKKAKLRQMAVVNKLQGKGIGRALIQFAENLARDHGFA